jgi:O-Antigen ligase
LGWSTGPDDQVLSANSSPSTEFNLKQAMGRNFSNESLASVSSMKKMFQGFRATAIDFQGLVSVLLAVGLPLYPPVALGYLTKSAFRFKSRSWPALWVLMGLPIVIVEFSQGRYSGAMTAIGFIGLMVLAGNAIHARRDTVVLGFSLSLLILILACEVQKSWDAQSWWYRPATKVSEASGVTRFQSGNEPVFRYWTHVPGSAVMRLEFQARTLEVPDEWRWEPSEAGFKIQSQIESGVPWTRIRFPKGRDPYVSTVIDTGKPLSGRTFRVSLEMRSPQGILALGCRGVWLQEYGRAFASGCLPVTLRPRWQRVTFSWTAPRAQDSPNSLRVVLNDFDGLELDVRGLRLEQQLLDKSAWSSLLQSWVGVQWPGSSVSYRVGVEPNTNWRSYRLDIDAYRSAGPEIQAIAWPGQFNIELRGVRLIGTGSDRPVPKSPSTRIGLWYPSPNLLGHVIVVLGLGVMTLAQRFRWTLLASLLTLLALLPTGSRTAWLGFVFGGTILLGLTSFHRRLKLSVVALLLIVVVVFFAGGLERLSLISLDSRLEDGNPVSRPEIWSAAWQALLDNPMGVGEGGFQGWFSRIRPGSTAIQHAHNFWFELAVRHGWIGLFSAFGFTGTVLWFGWRWGKMRALVFVASAFVMNIFDYTMFYPGVVYPLLLVLNAFRTQVQVVVD